jgi:hypothetical protein
MELEGMLLGLNTGRGTLTPGILGNLPTLMLVERCRRQLPCRLHIESPNQNLDVDVGMQTWFVDEDIQVPASCSSIVYVHLRHVRIAPERREYLNCVELDGEAHTEELQHSATLMEVETYCC